ncbi:MAG: DUF4115 domain-containing protein [Chloroflexaceae bacterium]|nr:DUF4115 domain-containing protein [Chloroflexaceae bacterium]
MRRNILPDFLRIFFVTMAVVGLVYIAVRSVVGMTSEVAQAVPTVTVTLPVPTASPSRIPLPSATPTHTPSLTSSPTRTATPIVVPTVVITPTVPFTPDITLTDTLSITPTAVLTEVAAVVPATEVPTPEPLPTETAQPVPTSTARVPTRTPRPTRTARATPTPTLSAPIVVQVSVVDETDIGSWMRVTTDGIIVYEQIMPPSIIETFTAEERINIRIGNPTVVRISVNGGEPETVGNEEGVPIDWTWPPIEPEE